MKQDFRETPHFRSVVDFYATLFSPGEGHVHAARDFLGRAEGEYFFFIGQIFTADLEQGPTNHLYRLPQRGGAPESIEASDPRHLCLAADGHSIAFASLSPDGQDDHVEIIPSAGKRISYSMPGRIEQIEWSPDGSRVLVLVAAAGVDVAGYQGGYTLPIGNEDASWLPEVRTNEQQELGRTLWMCGRDLKPVQISRPPLNIWEASWCGPTAIAAIASDHHGEGSWYGSRLVKLDCESGIAITLWQPDDQIGLPKASPDGRYIAFVTSLCSDRGIICGTLNLLNTLANRASPLETDGVDISSLEWRSPTEIHFAGIRRDETVVGDYDLDAGARQIWSSTDRTCGEWYPRSYPFGAAGALVVSESYGEAPSLSKIEGGTLSEILGFANLASASARETRRYGHMEPVHWPGSDQDIIYGWILRPADCTGPTPLLVDVHGGPIWNHRNRWMARLRAAPLLAERGWSILFPNPHGSTGQGPAFVRAVREDMGGRDSQDIIAGIDALVARGWVDTDRIAVTGSSYGGFMSAWLVTRSDRFAASIPISPISNWYSLHRTTHVPQYTLFMLGGSPWEPGGAYFDRSPAMHRPKGRTPTLILAGAHDKNTPPGQAVEFHQSLVEQGVTSALAIYPDGGHSLRGYPEYPDSAARILWWLERHVTQSSPSPAGE